MVGFAHAADREGSMVVAHAAESEGMVAFATGPTSLKSISNSISAPLESVGTTTIGESISSHC